MVTHPRLLQPADLPQLMRLKSSAGWNQTEADWLRLLELAPDGCFGIEVDGAPAATTTAICYGTDLAWIGMVLTLPEYRRRGLARVLMRHALDWLRERGAGCIKLDSTDLGRPLYEELGFRVEGPVERWLRPPGACLEAEPLELDLALDRAAFGADRSVLVCRLGAGREGSQAAYFGPCVARSAGDAESQLRWFLSRRDEPVYWDLLPENREAVRIALGCGFSRVRSLHRMVHGGGRIDHDDSKVFAIAGFEYG